MVAMLLLDGFTANTVFKLYVFRSVGVNILVRDVTLASRTPSNAATSKDVVVSRGRRIGRGRAIER